MLQPTALVHKAYRRPVDARGNVSWRNRAHLRGGLEQRVSLEGTGIALEDSVADRVALDGALETFARDYPRQSEVIVLKFSGGLETREIARALRVSEKPGLCDWNFTRPWLCREIGTPHGHV